MTNFDLFRLNCFLNDTKANDFKRIIISLVSEYIFDLGNEFVDVKVCYKHLIEYHKLDMDFDYFFSVVENNNGFEKTALLSNVLIKLTSKKIKEINDEINSHLIDVYILKFLEKHLYPIDLLEPIKSLLYQAVYENMSTFSTENLSDLISAKIHTDFENVEIEAFNHFLEDKDHDKNTAVYNVFLKAIEFAIITSGKGIKEFSKDIFNGKTYCLDTNILFRILGIGGKERQDTLISLIKSCNHQGIIFEYTPQTLGELRRTLSASVRFLQSAEAKFDVLTLGELTESDPHLFNEDFISHYSKLRMEKVVNNPDQYELLLLSEFKTHEEKLGFKLSKGDLKIDEKQKDKLAEHLFKSKKKNVYSSRYTKTAANIDASNILYVRNLRGSNNYNYADVKSFYLSTDRSLNSILSKDTGIKIPETILPSQLYILHHPYMSNGEEVDYELFLQFVKRRTTEFHLKGTEVLTYINIIRRQTSSKTQLRTILQVYADKRYENIDNGTIEERKIKSLEEIMETLLDKKIAKGEMDSAELETIKGKAYYKIGAISRNTRFMVRVLDIVLTIAIIPLSLLIAKDHFKSISVLIVITLILELIKFLITSKTRLWNYVWKILLINTLKSSGYYKLSGDEKFVLQGFEIYNSVDGEIWKKLKN